MKRVITNLNIAGCNRALRAGVMILSLGLNGCFDDQKTDPVESFDLTVSVTGNGSVSSTPVGIDCGSDCTETLAAGSTITLSAIPASGFIFSGWSGGCSGNSPTCALTLDSSQVLTATFVPSPPPGDVTPPAVTLSAPAAGEVSGVVVLSANATDNVAIAGVQFRVNGENHDSEDTVAPYSVNWNTVSLSPGTYVLSAVARDTTGLTATSAGITVTVQAPATGRADLSWVAPTTNEDGSAASLSGFTIYQGTSSSNLQAIATVNSSTLSYTINNLATGTHYFAVTAVGANGMESTYSNAGSKTIP